ncbi:MAG TPA: sigma factor [Phycisphaerae bacterium]|nr:sigma factor [Phycisphaerae bacterium]
MTDAAVPSSPAAATREEFVEVMRANIDLVYSAALRQVGDAHLAQDVTQAVFIVLMKKWDRLGRNRALEGWLIKTTWFVAADARKQLRRQKIHEQKAAGMQRSDQRWRNRRMGRRWSGIWMRGWRSWARRTAARSRCGS